jgi:hypothetical protein
VAHSAPRVSKISVGSADGSAIPRTYRAFRRSRTLPIRRDAGCLRCGFGHRKGSAARMAWRRSGLILATLGPPW